MDFPKRKPNRLSCYDYSTPGAYFLTICVEGRKCILGRIVGGGNTDAPKVALSAIGTIVQRNIESSKQIPRVYVDKYVIMPNHIHLLLLVDAASPNETPRSLTPANAVIPRYVSALKRFCHKTAGIQIFQRS